MDVILTAEGPVTAASIERVVESVPGIDRAAAVGVGPAGTQHVAVIVAPRSRTLHAELASDALTDRVRHAVDVDIAAVFVAPALPVAHEGATVDRDRIERWARVALAGGRIGKL